MRNCEMTRASAREADFAKDEQLQLMLRYAEHVAMHSFRHTIAGGVAVHTGLSRLCSCTPGETQPCAASRHKMIVWQRQYRRYRASQAQQHPADSRHTPERLLIKGLRLWPREHFHFVTTAREQRVSQRGPRHGLAGCIALRGQGHSRHFAAGGRCCRGPLSVVLRGAAQRRQEVEMAVRLQGRSLRSHCRAAQQASVRRARRINTCAHVGMELASNALALAGLSWRQGVLAQNCRTVARRFERTPHADASTSALECQAMARARPVLPTSKRGVSLGMVRALRSARKRLMPEAALAARTAAFAHGANATSRASPGRTHRRWLHGHGALAAFTPMTLLRSVMFA